jgi:hypothetical protein
MRRHRPFLLSYTAVTVAALLMLCFEVHRVYTCENYARFVTRFESQSLQ